MKPILFNTEMVRAIQDGRKTVTRRLNKDANDYCEPLNSFIDNDKCTYAVQNYGDKEHTNFESLCELKMPICVGDILYVRETWNSDWCDHVIYKADGGSAIVAGYNKEPQWHPSIHMPKAVARIFLRVINVRVERLQDINNQGHHDDFYKEGCPVVNGNSYPHIWFTNIWNFTIKKQDIEKYSWDANPWVWVIEFEQITREEAYAE